MSKKKNSSLHYVIAAILIFLAGYYTCSRTKSVPEPPQEATVSEEEAQMFEEARAYVIRVGKPAFEFDLEVIKKTEKWALLNAIPKHGETDPAGVILEKVGSRWVGRTMGTIFPEWSKKVPELFE